MKSRLSKCLGLFCRVRSGNDAAKWHAYGLLGSQPHHNVQTFRLGARMSIDSRCFSKVFIFVHTVKAAPSWTVSQE